MRYAICLLVILSFTCGCPPNPGKTKSKEVSQTHKDRKRLTQTIVFKTAAMIQREYLEKYPNVLKDQQSKFYAYLNDTALSKKNITKEKAGSLLKAPPYSQCIRRIIDSDKSPWTIKKVLQNYDFNEPVNINRKGETLFNPYVFLPNPVDIDFPGQNPDPMTLVDLFYTGILTKEDSLVQAIYPHLIKAMKDFPRDREVFEHIFHLYKDSGSRLYPAQPLAVYYLISGDLDTKQQLTAVHREKLREAAGYYHRHYYQKEYITVNQYTLKNKVFMWLAARENEQAGDIHKANVYLKTTFDNSVLQNVKNFHPNHQVYLYSTIRIALQIPSPEMYRYVYAALDPLTKFKYTTYKELLKMQLLQLME